MQSLCHFFQEQLTTYYHLISVLESQMPPSNGKDGDEDQPGDLSEGSGLTLLRLGVWTRDARLKMRLMSVMVESSSGPCPSIRGPMAIQVLKGPCQAAMAVLSFL